jgi:hypothetical protein
MSLIFVSRNVLRCNRVSANFFRSFSTKSATSGAITEGSSAKGAAASLPIIPLDSLVLDRLNYNDHSWRQRNHVWTTEEVADRMKTETQKHTPVEFSDYVMKGLMSTLYHTFNFITGYKHVDPTPGSIVWRLIILESVAGVPGFLGAGFRHFYSLRTLQHDHGMIFTLLEEAENERMHLLTCMEMFKASFVTRSLVIAAQMSMTPVLALTYFIKPAAVHRFVGYLEETAVQTYSNVVRHVEQPNTKLNLAWKDLPAPDIAINYWHLPEGQRMWVDVLKRMLADEAHHRDVNHTLASLPKGATNPFVEEHMADFDSAVLRRSEKVLKAALAKHTASVSAASATK